MCAEDWNDAKYLTGKKRRAKHWLYMKKSTCNNQKLTKNSILPYLVSVFVILIFGYIIAKDVSLPRAVTLPVILAGLMFIIFSNFRSPVIPFYVLVMYLPFNVILTGRFIEGLAGINLTNIFTVIAASGWFLQI